MSAKGKELNARKRAYRPGRPLRMRLTLAYSRKRADPPVVARKREIFSTTIMFVREIGTGHLLASVARCDSGAWHSFMVRVSFSFYRHFFRDERLFSLCSHHLFAFFF